MAGGGRPKKPIALKKLEGTYRADRDSEQEKKENALVSVLPVGNLKVPKSITNPVVKKALKNHIELLRCLGGAAEQKADSPILESAYYALQVAYEFREKMESVGPGSELWENYSVNYLKYMDKFEKLAKDFYLTPQTRVKLKLDALTAQEKVLNVEEKKSAVASLLEKKQS